MLVQHAPQYRIERAAMKRFYHLPFLRRFLKAPRQVGSLLPSSRRLTVALTKPFAERSTPARVLEAGAGTGPITRRLGDLLGPDDHLDICEVDDHFVKLLKRRVLATGPLAGAQRQGRVRLLHCPVQDIQAQNQYDFIISGLPLNGFDPQEVMTVLDTYKHLLRPGGVLSYFEYVGARRLLRYSPRQTSRRRIRAVSRLLDTGIAAHQVQRHTVLANFPPAHARHWRFDTADAA